MSEVQLVIVLALTMVVRLASSHMHHGLKGEGIGLPTRDTNNYKTQLEAQLHHTNMDWSLKCEAFAVP